MCGFLGLLSLLNIVNQFIQLFSLKFAFLLSKHSWLICCTQHRVYTDEHRVGRELDLSYSGRQPPALQKLWFLSGMVDSFRSSATSNPWQRMTKVTCLTLVPRWSPDLGLGDSCNACGSNCNRHRRGDGSTHAPGSGPSKDRPIK